MKASVWSPIHPDKLFSFSFWQLRGHPPMLLIVIR